MVGVIVGHCFGCGDLVAVGQEEHAVEVGFEAADVVGSDDRRLALGPEVVEDAGQDRAGIGIDRIHRFVEQQQVRPLHQCPGQERALLLTT